VKESRAMTASQTVVRCIEDQKILKLIERLKQQKLSTKAPAKPARSVGQLAS
jgi:hypothetical protein